MEPLARHNEGIQINRDIWNQKELLRKVYSEFYNLFKTNLSNPAHGLHLELGSGSGQIKEFIPECTTSDLFENSWVDRKENAYELQFEDQSVDNLLLLDVFHHLKYPGLALEEFFRVLKPGGRVLVIDPYISLLGKVVYGVFHPEPVASADMIEWFPKDKNFEHNYYAAQGNFYRVFFSGEFSSKIHNWKIVMKKRLSSLSYVASGGFGKAQLYPLRAYPLMKKLDRILDFFPEIFATRAFVVLEKPF
ncbi:MAG: class I SAM-dependent methyltransferase [Proteobacteria bacterium]|nr:class I SAM-dependent methyltransferase [Pseudomonadota bacterium]